MGNLVRSVLKRTGLMSNNRAAITAVDRRLTYNSDGLATIHNADFLHEPRFLKAYRAGTATPHDYGENLHVEWRVRVALWAADIGKRLPGDFVECGVNSGILSRAIMEYVDFRNLPDKQFYLLDTFCGIPEGTMDEEQRRQANSQYRDVYDTVVTEFAPFENARLIRGRIPDTLDQVTTDTVCYLSIDLNVAAPEIAAGEYFWPRLSPGAVILLDDYGWPGQEEQKKAWDAFAKERDVPLLPLPTAQGVIVKP